MDFSHAARLKQIALGLPEATEGLSCPGTALETPTVQVRKKAFLFVGREHIRLKLTESHCAAGEVSSMNPDACEVGRQGWIKVTLSELDEPYFQTLEAWVLESYRAFAPKKLAAELDAPSKAD